MPRNLRILRELIRGRCRKGEVELRCEGIWRGLIRGRGRWRGEAELGRRPILGSGERLGGEVVLGFAL